MSDTAMKAMKEATATTLLHPDFVLVDVEAGSREELIARMADALIARGTVNASYKNAVLAREVKFPTGLPTLGLKVAIPHTDPEHVNESFVSIARLATPVAFEEMGGSGQTVDAEIVFMLALADSHSQLATLQLLIGMFSQEAIMARLRDARTSAELFDVIVSEIFPTKQKEQP